MKPACAAAYCGMSVVVFRRRCPVVPIDFGDIGGRRLERYDRHDIDDWIDGLRAPAVGLTSASDAFAEFKRANRRSQKRKD